MKRVNIRAVQFENKNKKRKNTAGFIKWATPFFNAVDMLRRARRERYRRHPFKIYARPGVRSRSRPNDHEPYSLLFPLSDITHAPLAHTRAPDTTYILSRTGLLITGLESLIIGLPVLPTVTSFTLCHHTSDRSRDPVRHRASLTRPERSFSSALIAAAFRPPSARTAQNSATATVGLVNRWWSLHPSPQNGTHNV